MAVDYRAVALVGLILLAGCATLSDPPTTTTPASTTTTTAPTAITSSPSPASTTTDDPPKGTQFVSVSPLQNQNDHEEYPDEQTVTFENLTEDRRAQFERALDGRVTVPPDETSPFSYYDEDRPRVVRYEGIWYHVRVTIV